MPHPADARGTATEKPSGDALSVDVEQAANGGFVYTLRDTDSGKLVVIIPHVELKMGGEVDARA